MDEEVLSVVVPGSSLLRVLCVGLQGVRVAVAR